MRRIIENRVEWFLVAIVALIFSLGWGRMEGTPAQAQLLPAAVGTGGLITHFYDDPGGGPTRVIVIDSLKKRMAVYHVPVNDGDIQLKSVRNLTVDLQVQEFNSGKPLTVSPIDMKKMLDRN